MQMLQKKKYISPRKDSRKKIALLIILSPTIGFFILYSFYQRHKELTYIESIILVMILLFSTLSPWVWSLIRLRKESKWFKDDYGDFIGWNKVRDIKKIEKEYMKNISPKNTLELADMYRKYRMRKVAMIYYKNLLENFSLSSEANVAEMRIEELKNLQVLINMGTKTLQEN